jgi:thioredoxin 2
MTDSAAATAPVLLRCQNCRTLNRIDLARRGDRPRCARCQTGFRLDRPQPVGDADFQTLIEGAGVPVLVDFYADWCGPCRAMAPALERFAAEQAGRALVLKLDTDANPQTAARFRIQGIPTLISFRNGSELRRHVGMADAGILHGLLGG